MPNPGAIQMRKGRWRIYTALRGYRPQWMPLTPAFVAGRIRAFLGATETPLTESRAMAWVSSLEGQPDRERLREIAADMRYVATKTPETRWQKVCAEWAGWLRWIVQVQFKQETTDGG